ncbi:MAG TPA: NADH:ubiquinone reductase (Na(+)-transporting) subunit B [Bacteroidales bacterium]|nr:NADH:ubiquinone reductase (Na(+)-transporting) subunit B [Bacteroidales bacterium]HQP03949.1 NADH:ubiquinone reductase (Na(+)-transporting) subunit B [Bacteroidales bacterium]
MKSVRKLLDKAKPNFESGGKLYFLHSFFDAMETFLFVPDKVTEKGAHIRDAIDMKRTMILVVVALMPAFLFGVWNTGFQFYFSRGIDAGFWQIVGYGLKMVIPLYLVSYGVGVGVEVIVAQIRKHEVNEGVFVTSFLIPLLLPADIPLWMLAVATAFAVLIGKEIFGGTGMNIMNPALLARAFLFFAYPAWMSGDKVWVSGLTQGEGVVDGFTGATPLAQAAAGSPHFTDGLGNTLSTMDLFIGAIPGSIGETSKLAILLGAALLLFAGIASWRVMFSMLIGGMSVGILMNVLGNTPYMQIPFYDHLLIGSFLFGMVFMATDPVTAAQTNTGKFIYGFLIGVMIMVIRVLNPAYPEGTMLAILLMNVFAPLIDHYVVQANISKRLKRFKQIKA